MINVSSILEWTSAAIAILSACGITIELIPQIKLNPITWIFNKIGASLNKTVTDEVKSVKTELSSEIDGLKQDISQVKKDLLSHDINQKRCEILDFANACRNGRRHTKEQFDHIIEVHSEYNKLIEANNMVNGKMDLDYQYISDLYLYNMKHHRFLDDMQRLQDGSNTFIPSQNGEEFLH